MSTGTVEGVNLPSMRCYGAGGAARAPQDRAQQTLPNAERAQHQFVRYPGAAHAVESPGGWLRSRDSRSALWHPQHVQELPERLSLRVVQAPMEWMWPVREHQQFKAAFQVLVAVLASGQYPLDLTVAVTPHLLSEHDTADLARWQPTESSRAHLRHCEPARARFNVQRAAASGTVAKHTCDFSSLQFERSTGLRAVYIAFEAILPTGASVYSVFRPPTVCLSSGNQYEPALAVLDAKLPAVLFALQQPQAADIHGDRGWLDSSPTSSSSSHGRPSLSPDIVKRPAEGKRISNVRDGQPHNACAQIDNLLTLLSPSNNTANQHLMSELGRQFAPYALPPAQAGKAVTNTRPMLPSAAASPRSPSPHSGHPWTGVSVPVRPSPEATLSALNALAAVLFGPTDRGVSDQRPHAGTARLPEKRPALPVRPNLPLSSRPTAKRHAGMPSSAPASGLPPVYPRRTIHEPGMLDGRNSHPHSLQPTDASASAPPRGPPLHPTMPRQMFPVVTVSGDAPVDEGLKWGWMALDWSWKAANAVARRQPQPPKPLLARTGHLRTRRMLDDAAVREFPNTGPFSQLQLSCHHRESSRSHR